MEGNRLLALALVLAAASVPACAQAYKWVDENGRTHFSDVPPPNGKPANRVTIRPQLPANPQASNSTRDWRSQIQESNLHNAQQQAREEAAQRDRQVAESNCGTARGRLNGMQGSRIFRYNTKGEREYYDEEQRSAAIAAEQRRVDQYCR
jgi:hypothetical protein